MAWRIVVQPNGKYAGFADPVDHFTHYDMTREEAFDVCCRERDMGPQAAEEKIRRAEGEPYRYAEALETIEVIHGKAERNRIEHLTS